MSAIKGKGMDAEAGGAQQRIRITMTSRNVPQLERMCTDLKKAATGKGLAIKGPVRLPTKTLHITTRKSPCGEGTNTWDRFEMRIHKRIMDLTAPVNMLKEITSISGDASVDVELTLVG